MSEEPGNAPVGFPAELASSGISAGSSNSKKRRNRNRNAKSESRSPNRNAILDSDQGNRSSNKSKSRSPIRSNANQDKSRSPTRGQGKNKSRSPGRNNPRRHKKPLAPPADMTVICNRTDLWDSAAHFQPDDSMQQHHHYPDTMVNSYSFVSSSRKPSFPDHASLTPIEGAIPSSIAVARVPYHFGKSNMPKHIMAEGEILSDVVDTITPNPHDPSIVHDKYWCQRRRLFSRFDMGIQLDGQGWYSVTPEIIADHVAKRVAELATTHVIPHESSRGIVILDAFCGCGGNSIAFGKISSNIISKVICVDTDRSKLLKAAHNASLYDIPRDKLIFVECNSTFIMQHCYKNGEFVLDKPTANLPSYMPAPVMPTMKAGYHIGGLDMLPRQIDAVFMDPPWGGVDYEVLGKNGYDLQKNMKIQVGPPPEAIEDDYEADGDGCDDFFDTFAPAPSKPKSKMSQRARKANFNKQAEGGHFIDGMELLRVAAEATTSHVVVYDLPRNTNKSTLGKCALGAGYRGNIKLEEHYLNGRLKTVTAYMGADYSEMINSLHKDHTPGEASGDEA